MFKNSKNSTHDTQIKTNFVPKNHFWDVAGGSEKCLSEKYFCVYWLCKHLSRKCHSMTVWNECLYHAGLSPMPMDSLVSLQYSNSAQYESTNQRWERWPNVWTSVLLNAGYYYTPPPPVLVLSLTNLLGYRGPAIVKPALCLESGPWDWALDGSRQELYFLVEVPPFCPASIKVLNPLWH